MAKRTGSKVTTNKVRLGYVHLFEPHAHEEGQEKKYGLVVLIPKDDTETIDLIKEAQKLAAEEGKAKFNGKVLKNLKTTLRDGDTDDSIDLEKNPEYEDHFFLNATNKMKPHIVSTMRDEDGKFIEITEESEMYSGCYGRVSLQFFAYNTAGNKGITCSLQNVQKVADGERLSGGIGKAEDDFDDDYDEEDDML
ncbi:DUF2815 family protein [Listeria booriae]|uniref:DUF2815 family protein n=1 Tax=Listeria booriae TaxID=1552123 RepID=UPI0016239431|nr:DUF2815 family protein [Listeria booriae]MBC1272660.1 DUF2815 family protein [Listeria booriae]MBC1651292.1 DUF2815 family protein [Listeria booriae]MBC2174762.1 DUF2815 family protein [Listeria booriae]